MKTTHHRVADDFSAICILSGVYEVKSQAQDYDDTQYQHVMPIPRFSVLLSLHSVRDRGAWSGLRHPRLAKKV